MNWDMIGVIAGIIVIQGGVLIAAAKSIFVTKKDYNEDTKILNAKLYDDKSISIYVPRGEWIESRSDREKRRDNSQRALCDKIVNIQNLIAIMQKTQNATNVVIGTLLGRFEQYIKKQNNKD